MTSPSTMCSESLENLFAVATDRASAAMEAWTGGAISLKLDEVCEVALEEAIPRLGVGDEPVIVVILRIEGELAGDIVLMFADRDGRLLCSDLTRNEPDFEAPWSDLEKSAVMETGNILASAYLNGLSPVLEHNLVPSPPQFLQDFGSSIIEQVLMPHAMTADTLFVSNTTFLRRETGPLSGHVFVIPTAELQQRMTEKVKLA